MCLKHPDLPACMHSLGKHVHLKFFLYKTSGFIPLFLKGHFQCDYNAQPLQQIFSLG